MEKVTAVGITPRNNSRQHSNQQPTDQANGHSADNDSSNNDKTHQNRFTSITELLPIIEKLNEIGSMQAPHFSFIVKNELDNIEVEMTDGETGELLLSIPGAEFLSIATDLLIEGDSLHSQPGRWIELDA